MSDRKIPSKTRPLNGLRFNVLASGSEGNCLALESASPISGKMGLILLDCGLTIKELSARFADSGYTIEDIFAILVTHEHGDHLGSGVTLAKRLKIPIYMSRGTALQAKLSANPDLNLQFCRHDQSLSIHEWTIQPFTVPHDAREPLQFCLTAHGQTLVVLTDAGHITPKMVEMLRLADSIVLESNHDRLRLQQSNYPRSLKNRIAGEYGHLTNDCAVALLSQLEVNRIRTVVAAHLSLRNNCSELVRANFAKALQRDVNDVVVALQEAPTGWLPI